jgi:hypothetical protein
MKPPECAFGCGPLAIPILAMNRGDEQKHCNPTHRLGCPACGETWPGTDAEVAQAERAEGALDRRLAREHRQAERKAKDETLRARLAAAPKVGGR